MSHERLRKVWPWVRQVTLGAWIAACVIAALATWARLPFAATLRFAAFAIAIPTLAMGVIEEILERLKWVDKTPESKPFNPEAPPLPEPIPVSQAAPPDPATEPEAQPHTETLTPLGGGALPETFKKDGRKAVWRVEGERD